MAPPQRAPRDSCSHRLQQDFSSSTFRLMGQNKREREVLSPFPFPSLRRLLFKETLPSKKGIAAALGFPPTIHAATLWRRLSKDLLSRAVWKTKSVVQKFVGSTEGMADTSCLTKSVRFLLLAESETSCCSPLLPLKTVPGIDVNWLRSIWPTKQGSEKL